MQTFQNQHGEGATQPFVVSISQHAPTALFCACGGSFLLLLVITGNHDVATWQEKMPTLGILVGAGGALFVQVVRACGLLASTYNFSRGRAGIFSGILSIILSLCVSLYEHNHAPTLSNFYIHESETDTRLYLTAFVQVLIWIGLGLELLIIASIYGSRESRPKTAQKFSANGNGHHSHEEVDFSQGNGANH